MLLRPTDELNLRAAYGEGIAQPTFYDLYGFFPGSFTGNPALQPEHSRGWEAGIVWREERWELAATWFSARLKDEIVDVSDPATFVSTTANASGASRREGLELSAAWWPADGLAFFFNYTWLDADEQRVAGAAWCARCATRAHKAIDRYRPGGRLSWGATTPMSPAADTGFRSSRRPRYLEIICSPGQVAFPAAAVELYARAETPSMTIIGTGRL